MQNKLQLAKAYARAHIEDPACICYGVRAAMADGCELFNLTNAELVELHEFACEVVEARDAWSSRAVSKSPWHMGSPDTGAFLGLAAP